MSGILNSLYSMGVDAVSRMQSQTDPRTVKQVNVETYDRIPVMDRQEYLVLYGPRMSKRNDSDLYDIVLHEQLSKHRSYSIFRSTDVAEVLEEYSVFRRYIPLLWKLEESSFASLSQIQILINYIVKHPKTSLAHLMVIFDLKTSLVKPEISSFINAKDGESGITPLMLAIERENVSVTKILVNLEVDLMLTDEKGCTAFHYSAKTTKEIVEIVCLAKKGDIDERNHAGHSALHVACLNDKPECVKALLCAGADVNLTGTIDNEYPIYSALKNSESPKCAKEIIEMYPKQLHTHDIKYGGTPLHWAMSKDIINALIQLGCCMNAKNFNGDTALHVMVERQRLDCVLALISNGVDINIRDKNGNSPLHLAVELANCEIVRALLVFDCSTSLVNKNGDTAWTLALKKREFDIMDTFTFKDRLAVVYSLYAVNAAGTEEAKSPSGIKFDFSRLSSSFKYKRSRCFFDEILTVLTNASENDSIQKHQPAKGGRLLSLDGGGIKGLVLIRMLRSIELLLEVDSVRDLFDWIAGTSTGGILALGLASGRSVIECQALYFRLKDLVFVGSKPYSVGPLEELLKEEFGHEKKMRQMSGPTKVMITATLSDRSPPDSFYFRNYESGQEILGVEDFPNPDLESGSTSLRDPLIWRAARASGAAPSFFRAEECFVDGGIMNNNPSLALLTDIAERNLALKATNKNEDIVKPSILVSLGTGVPPVRKTSVVDIFRPNSAHDTLKLFLGWDGMGKLMLDSILDADGKIVDQSRAFCYAWETAFYRFSPPLVTDIDLDEKNDKVLVDLMWSTMVYMCEKKDEILALKKFLVKK